MALGENLWRRFIFTYLEALGAPVVAIGAYGSTEDLLDGPYQYPVSEDVVRIDMRAPTRALGFLLTWSTLAVLANTPAQAQNAAAWKPVDDAMGRTGRMQPGEVYRYAFPRSDLQVSVNGVALKPALALGSWVAFKRMGGGAVAMGDLVLLEEELTPVLTKLQEMGVQQTALHNHLQHASPQVMYLHIFAEGDPVKVAQAVRMALALTKTPPAAPPAAPGSSFTLDTAQLASVLGHRGTVNGGVYQVSVPRAETIRDHGMEVPPAMGVATVINFQPTTAGKAAITGDFVLLADEVNPVLRELRDAGIAVTALHSHMLGETPRLFFMHFWANDDAVKLTRGLRAALDRTNVQKASSR